MGWVLMIERELQRIEVLTAVLSGRQTVTAAARLLGLSRRHLHRLMNAYEAEGVTALRHGLRGQRSNRALSHGLRERALDYVRDQYADFGPTLACEKLPALHGRPPLPSQPHNRRS